MTRLSENVNANYNEQEQSIFNDNSHVKKLIESLERSTDEAQSQ